MKGESLLLIEKTSAVRRYPVEACIPDIKSALLTGRNLVLSALPGAGKSTVVPPALKDEPWLQGKKILLMQPRRIAAVSIARRICTLANASPGTIAGHRVRFSSNISPSTKIEVLTEGMLTVRIQKDPDLSDVGLVIFDEFHERNLESDLCLALCGEIQREIRSDLRIMVMSATIDPELICRFLPNCAQVHCPGFLHQVQMSFMPVNPGRNMFESMAERCAEIVGGTPSGGRFLVFLPGAHEIMIFKSVLEADPRTCGYVISVLHGSMKLEKQDEVLARSNEPEIILSTNIAETSLTVEGISTVIDSGYRRRKVHDPSTGLESLQLARISRSSADQRAGRAGRVGPGRVFRFWTRTEHELLDESEQAEIMRSDISRALLELLVWGCRDLRGFLWFEHPGNDRIDDTMRLLMALGAVDNSGSLTDDGRSMAGIPLHPRLACMLISAAKAGITELAATAAAIISEKDIMADAFRQDKNSVDPDLAPRIEMLENYLSGIDNRSNFRNELGYILRIRELLMRSVSAFARKADIDMQSRRSLLGLALLKAFPDRLCAAREDGSPGKYTICSGQGLKLASNSSLNRQRLLLALNIDLISRHGESDGRIFLAFPVTLESIRQLGNSLLAEKREIIFSESKCAVIVRERIYYGKLILRDREASLSESDAEAAEALLHEAASKRIRDVFNLDSNVNRSFIRRISLLQEHGLIQKTHTLDQDWLKSILARIIPGCRSFDDLKKWSLRDLYLSTAEKNLRKALVEDVPEKIRVPSGNMVTLRYDCDGPPVLAVKMQEMFGCTDTPTICRGRQPLLVHLLSPSGRPVQITSDLESFWRNGYRYVIGELKGRYPRHPWPDDPIKAVPTAKTRKSSGK